jgi:hypothetical protein
MLLRLLVEQVTLRELEDPPEFSVGVAGSQSSRPWQPKMDDPPKDNLQAE